jgi:hypothetical protein
LCLFFIVVLLLMLYSLPPHLCYFLFLFAGIQTSLCSLRSRLRRMVDRNL